MLLRLLTPRKQWLPHGTTRTPNTRKLTKKLPLDCKSIQLSQMFGIDFTIACCYRL